MDYQKQKIKKYSKKSIIIKNKRIWLKFLIIYYNAASFNKTNIISIIIINLKIKEGRREIMTK